MLRTGVLTGNNVVPIENQQRKVNCSAHFLGLLLNQQSLIRTLLSVKTDYVSKVMQLGDGIGGQLHETEPP